MVKLFAKGRERLEIAPDVIPFQYRGCYTGKLYVWTSIKPVQIVDRRDVPKLRALAGDKFPALRQDTDEKDDSIPDADAPVGGE